MPPVVSIRSYWLSGLFSGDGLYVLVRAGMVPLEVLRLPIGSYPYVQWYELRTESFSSLRGLYPKDWFCVVPKAVPECCAAVRRPRLSFV